MNPFWSQSLIWASLWLPHSKFDSFSLFPTDLLCSSELIKAVLGLKVSFRSDLSNYAFTWAIPPLLRLACAIFIVLPVFSQIPVCQHSSPSLTDEKITFSHIFIFSREGPMWGMFLHDWNNKEFEAESTSWISLFCFFYWEKTSVRKMPHHWQLHQY